MVRAASLTGQKDHAYLNHRCWTYPCVSYVHIVRVFRVSSPKKPIEILRSERHNIVTNCLPNVAISPAKCFASTGRWGETWASSACNNNGPHFRLQPRLQHHNKSPVDWNIDWHARSTRLRGFYFPRRFPSAQNWKQCDKLLRFGLKWRAACFDSKHRGAFCS